MRKKPRLIRLIGAGAAEENHGRVRQMLQQQEQQHAQEA